MPVDFFFIIHNFLTRDRRRFRDACAQKKKEKKKNDSFVYRIYVCGLKSVDTLPHSFVIRASVLLVFRTM